MVRNTIVEIGDLVMDEQEMLGIITGYSHDEREVFYCIAWVELDRSIVYNGYSIPKYRQNYIDYRARAGI